MDYETGKKFEMIDGFFAEIVNKIEVLNGRVAELEKSIKKENTIIKRQ